MSPGHLAVVGLGPGSEAMLTQQAAEVLATAEALYGYGPYLDRVPPCPGQARHPSDNRQELMRAGAALAAAAAGARIAVVSGGDPGVFAMAAAVCEAIEHGPESWRHVVLQVVPGITAMLALAARVGAPLGHDFCAISLSDNLKPWRLIQHRLTAAASAGFVIALYNPVSRMRPWQLAEAFAVLRKQLPGDTAVIFGRAIGRDGEDVFTVPISQADPARADMATCIIVGSAETRVVGRGQLPPLVYTPRKAGV